VHLGPEDISVHKARNILGPGKIIGASCHQSFEKAKQAVRDTANYVSFGAFYPSRTRADAAVLDHAILNQISELPIPVVAIGGINLERAKKLASQGVDHVAVISDLWNAEDIQAHAEAYQSIFSGVSNIYDRGLN
ncbi:MAG: thiamine phosphate synthase, partial [Gammaproteobacteria bacterium]|nr:thiamine phosphate synthase [Gammaproteobacteria bacterium]